MKTLIAALLFYLPLYSMENDNTSPIEAYENLKKSLGYDPQVVSRFEDVSYEHTNGTFGLEMKKAIGQRTLVFGCHGFGADKDQCISYPYQNSPDKKMYDYGCVFNFQDAQGNILKSSIGGAYDAKCAGIILQYLDRLYNPKNILLFGVSRGGAVVQRLLGQEKESFLPQTVYQKINGAVLDAPLVSLNTVIENKTEQIGNVVSSSILGKMYAASTHALGYVTPSFISSPLNSLAQLSTQGSTYSAQSTAKMMLPISAAQMNFKEIAVHTPLHYVKYIAPHIPLFLVTTKDDQLIPSGEIDRIAQERIKFFPVTKYNTYTLTAPTGDHITSFIEERNIFILLKCFYTLHAIDIFKEDFEQWKIIGLKKDGKRIEVKDYIESVMANPILKEEQQIAHKKAQEAVKQECGLD